jgi:signal transduction histidine kinase
MEVAAHPFFKQTDPAQLAAILAVSTTEDPALDALIFDEGAVADALYLVLRGRVVFHKRMRPGEWLTVNYSEAGDHFGEIGMLTGEPRSLRAVAGRDVRLLRIPGEALVTILRQVSGPVERLMQSVIQHLHKTTRHYVEDQLQQEKMAVVGNMMNTIIHDFKNPFCLISLSAQMLRQRHGDADSQRLCLNIERQIDRMVAMAAELYEYSRGEHTLKESDLELRALIEEFKSLNFPFFENPKVQVTIDMPHALPLRAEKAKLFRVFQNLIGNAIEAFGDKPGRLRISAHSHDDGKQVLIEVKDNAGGIPEEIRSRFFEPFVTFGKREGTGLGTAIVKSIVEAHGGTIRFETATGVGTTFFITLPTQGRG